jgi:biofilm PGA synthesis lipoprotein PgaB
LTKNEEKEPKVIVLTYHDLVNGKPINGSQLNINDFITQMDYLYRNNYHTLSLTEFLFYYQQKNFPSRSILLTFDDGYESFYYRAYPILKQYGFKAVIFPVVGYTPGIQQCHLWVKHLSFHQIRLMIKESGLIDVGVHTFDLHHKENKKPALYQQKGESPADYQARLTKDLRMAKDLLELETGQPVIALSWPFGKTNGLANEVALSLGYRLIFTIHPAPVTPETPLDKIPRYLIDNGSLEDLKRILN